MAIDGVAPTAIATVAATAVYHVGKAGFEFAAVREQVTKLLETIDKVVSDIEHARQLRSRKRKLLDVHERAKIDETIRTAEEAVLRLQALVEAVRVDMDVNWGKISVGSRIMWWMDRNNNVPTTLALLHVHHTALNTQITIMSLKSGDLYYEPVDNALERRPTVRTLRHRATVIGRVRPTPGPDDDDDDDDDGSDEPPSYQQATAEMMHRRRQSQRRPTSEHTTPQLMTRSNSSLTSRASDGFDPLAHPRGENDQTVAATLNNVYDYFAQDAEMMSPLLGIKLGENKSATGAATPEVGTTAASNWSSLNDLPLSASSDAHSLPHHALSDKTAVGNGLASPTSGDYALLPHSQSSRASPKPTVKTPASVLPSVPSSASTSTSLPPQRSFPPPAPSSTRSKPLPPRPKEARLLKKQRAQSLPTTSASTTDPHSSSPPPAVPPLPNPPAEQHQSQSKVSHRTNISGRTEILTLEWYESADLLSQLSSQMGSPATAPNTMGGALVPVAATGDAGHNNNTGRATEGGGRRDGARKGENWLAWRARQRGKEGDAGGGGL